MTYTEAPFVVTVKGGGNNNAPWIVVRGDTADEVEARLRDVYKLGPAAIATASAFANEWAAESGGAAAPQGQSPAVQAVAAGLGGQVVSSTPTSPAPSTSAPQAGVAGGSENVLKKDKWGTVFEFNHPNAPQTQHGPKVLKHAVGQDSGKQYSQWLYPTDKAVPGNYEAGMRESFPKEFAKGVAWRGAEI